MILSNYILHISVATAGTRTRLAVRPSAGSSGKTDAGIASRAANYLRRDRLAYLSTSISSIS